LFELGSFMPSSFEEYQQNIEKRAACERYFEKIIEAVIDVAFLLIKEKKLRIPEEDKETFDILVEEEIISTKLATRLKDAKGMRNILSHQYSHIDDEVVFEAITEELEKDVKEFLESIERIK
ncbi:MAG: DUF86 domain-containing protein, partial [Nanoarchaeota archaeon]